jgi:hypothetical protein
MVHEMNRNESVVNKDFVNLHSQNRKRRFNEINTPIHIQSNQINHNQRQLTSNQIINRENKTEIIQDRKTFQFVKNNKINETLNNNELERILIQLEKLKSRDDVKEYLKSFILQLIKKINQNDSDKIEKSTTENQNHINKTSDRQEEIKNINENLISDNVNLKKAVVTLYRKVEVIFLFL